MSMIQELIINSPYEEPSQHWSYDHQSRKFLLTNGRRSAGFLIASKDSKEFDDPGIFKEIKLVNRIRKRVADWRNKGYPGTTAITRHLLAHWTDAQYYEERRFFFCQIEAIETLIWWTEAPDELKVGIEMPENGSNFERICSKMATGTGKTIVMAMLIAWNVLNKVTNPRDRRFSKNIFVVAPCLTVKKRLSVIDPNNKSNYYIQFKIVPNGMLDRLRQGKILVKNWHVLSRETEEKIQEKRSVDKRGALSDTAYARHVLGDISSANRILVINDEAHHAWNITDNQNIREISKKQKEKATIWVAGLDRIHRKIEILKCYDFSATPFRPTGGKSSEENLFEWIISDFGLNDAIESGLVKTPRVVVRDDSLPSASSYKSKFYHIFNEIEVKSDLTRRAKPEEILPDLLINAYDILGADWAFTKKSWESSNYPTPPVMITVANRVETAARVRHMFESQQINVSSLCEKDKILHIDSRQLENAEKVHTPTGKTSNKKKLMAEALREKVDTVGKIGFAGEQIQNVISVNMLSEGWDAKTVTHIMGLRAFESQLLCEQVVGRGLRRTSYEINPETGLFESEYVNVFGVPFTFLPHESSDGPPPVPTPPKIEIKPVEEKSRYEMSYPNIIRVEHFLRPELKVDWNKVSPMKIDVSDVTKIVEIAPTIDGKPDITRIKKIDLIQLSEENRLQKIIFTMAKYALLNLKDKWSKNEGYSEAYLIAQLVKLTEEFITSDLIEIFPEQFQQDDLSRKLILALKRSSIINHFISLIEFHCTKKLEPIFDTENPISSTSDMQPWSTGKNYAPANKSHINYCVLDSTWEKSDSYHLDNSKFVYSWVKNDHLGFVINYLFKGQHHRYYPDFLVKLKNGVTLVIETKGKETEKDKVKHKYLKQWIDAVNSYGGFGKWDMAITRRPGEILNILKHFSQA